MQENEKLSINYEFIVKKKNQMKTSYIKLTSLKKIEIKLTKSK